MRQPVSTFTVSAITLFLLGTIVAAAAAPADVGLAAASPGSEGLDAKALYALGDAISRGDAPKTNAVLIVRHGRLVYEHYFNDGTAGLLNDTRSATKSITALAVGAAIADGAIPSVGARAFDFLADMRPFANDTPDKEAIAIRDLLTMSSALDCNDDDDKSPGNEDNMHPQSNWTRWAVDLPTMRGYKRDESGLGPWRYCTTGAFLLGQIVQRATHEPVDKYIERKILAPLGIAQWDWPKSPSGEIMTGGGLRLRARDLAKVAWMLADGGRWNGRQIVPASWIEAALSPYRQAYTDHHYGYLFWQYDYHTGCGNASGWYMAGNGGNAIVVLRELGAAVVIARANYNTHGMHQQTTDLMEKYVVPSMMCGRQTTNK
jgi:CubicO group peptidase (beta-lactamase class C family)